MPNWGQSDRRDLGRVQRTLIQRIEVAPLTLLAGLVRALVLVIDEKRILRGQPAPAPCDVRALLRVTRAKSLDIRDAYTQLTDAPSLHAAASLDADTFKESIPQGGPSPGDHPQGG